MIRGRVAGGVVALCVLVAGCSSTVQQTRSQLVSDGPAAVDGAADPDAAAAADNPLATDGGASSGGAGARTGVTTATKAAGGAKATGPVRVGINYSLSLGSIMTTFGAIDSTDGDAIDSIRPIVDYINAHGGIAGRKLEPVLHGVDPTRGTFAVQEQEACAAFTQDNTVNAVVTGAAAMSTAFTSCIARKDVPVLYEIQSLIDDATVRDHGGYLYQPLGITTERQGFFIDALAGSGYFDPNAKIGVLYADTPIMKRYLDQVVKAGLQRRGLSVTSEFAFAIPGSAADASSLFSQASNAVLKFRSAGITHVIFVPTGGALPYAFMPAAESQNYRPRYAMNSFEIPAFVDIQVNNKQLKGALAVGWLPTSDVRTPERPTDNPAERLCYKITNSRSDIPSRYCEGLFFLKAAWDASGEVTPLGLQRGAKMLGTTWRSPWTFGTSFVNGRADGATQYRSLRFDDGCQCFMYDGPLKAVP